MSYSFNLLLRQKVGVEDVVKCLNGFLNGGVESIECPSPDAVYFLMHDECTEGFRTGSFIAWAAEGSGFDDFALARYVAAALNTDLMFEPLSRNLPSSLEWVFMTSAGESYAAGCTELDDGIDIRPGSLIPI